MVERIEMTGFFITFEGGEGSGKSTQIKMLAAALAQMGKTVLTTREPGGCPNAEQIRQLLVTGSTDWDKTSETLLFYASRAEHLAKKIRPALEQGQVVLCDRFSDSTMAYQGYGYGDDPKQQELIKHLDELIVQEQKPDLTFVLDINPEEGLHRSRRADNTEQRFEDKELAFHQRLRMAYLKMAKENKSRFCVIDASQTIEAIHKQIITEIVNRKVLD